MGGNDRLIWHVLLMTLPILLGLKWLYWASADVVSNDINVDRVLEEALRITSRSWEYGTLAGAMLELQDPDLTVFAFDPFPQGRLPVLADPSKVAGLQYVKDLIWTNGSNSLTDGEGTYVCTSWLQRCYLLGS